jgi:hypothetical protein
MSAGGRTLLHIDEVALSLGLARHQVRGLIADGLMTAEKVDGRTYIPATAVYALQRLLAPA